MDERVVYTQYWQIYSYTLLDNVYFWQRGSETFHLLFCLFVYIVVLYIILQLTLKFVNPSACELWKARGN